MHNKTVSHIIFFLVAAVTSSLYSGESRFHLMVKQYTNHENVYEKRHLIVDLAALFDNHKKYYHPSLGETLLFDMTAKNIALGIQHIKKRETAFSDNVRQLTVDFDIEKYDQHYIQGSLEDSSLLFLDTTENVFALHGQYHMSRANYFLRNRKRTTPFIQLATILNSRVYHDTKSALDNDLAAINNDTLKFDWIVRSRQNMSLVWDIFGFIGAGRPTNITPVYQSLIIEKRLIRNGVAKYILSETTLGALAELLGRNNTYALKKYDYAREFKARVDSIILQDSAVEKPRLRYISSIELQKIMLCNTPLFLTRPRCRIFTASRLFTDIYRVNDHYPYTDIIPDTSYTKSKAHYEHLLGIDFRWGIPCAKYWFLDLYAQRNILSTDRKLSPINLNKALDIQLSIQSTWWISPWFICDAGVRYLPAWIVVPRAAPYQSYCNFNLFVEDNLQLKATVSYKKYNRIHTSYLYWFEPVTRIDEGMIISLSATYGF